MELQLSDPSEKRAREIAGNIIGNGPKGLQNLQNGLKMRKKDMENRDSFSLPQRVSFLHAPIPGTAHPPCHHPENIT